LYVVLDPPVVAIAASNVNETQLGLLNCSVSSKPESNITWYRRTSQRWEALPVTVRGNNSLSYNMVNASREDAGTYRCTANNGYEGDISREMEFVIRCKTFNSFFLYCNTYTSFLFSFVMMIII